MTWKTRKPCKFIFTRKETFSATNTRHEMCFDVKIGADKKGNIKAIDMRVLNNSGAYGSDAVIVAMESGKNSFPSYNKVPHLNYTAKTVYTNMRPGGALRGYGATQGTFALDSAINELAGELKMDSTVIKLKNTIRPSEVGGIIDNPLQSFNVVACIERGKELIGWDEKFPSRDIGGGKVRSVGIAIGTHVFGVANIDKGAINLRLVEDGSYMMLTGAGDTGTGSDTILAQIAAQALNTSVDSIKVLAGDTDASPYDSGAYASSITYVSGSAVIRAAREMELLLLKAAEKTLNIPSTSLELKKDRVSLKEDSSKYVLLQTLAENSQKKDL